MVSVGASCLGQVHEEDIGDLTREWSNLGVSGFRIQSLGFRISERIRHKDYAITCTGIHTS